MAGPDTEGAEEPNDHDTGKVTRPRRRPRPVWLIPPMDRPRAEWPPVGHPRPVGAKFWWPRPTWVKPMGVNPRAARN
jgi:hypothetical protein